MPPTRAPILHQKDFDLFLDIPTKSCLASAAWAYSGNIAISDWIH